MLWDRALINPINTGVNVRVSLILPIPICPHTKQATPSSTTVKVSTMFPPDPVNIFGLWKTFLWYVVLAVSSFNQHRFTNDYCSAEGQRPDLDSFGKTHMATVVENGNQPVGFPNGPIIHLRIVVGRISYSRATSGQFDWHMHAITLQWPGISLSTSSRHLGDDRPVEQAHSIFYILQQYSILTW